MKTLTKRIEVTLGLLEDAETVARALEPGKHDADILALGETLDSFIAQLAEFTNARLGFADSADELIDNLYKELS